MKDRTGQRFVLRERTKDGPGKYFCQGGSHSEKLKDAFVFVGLTTFNIAAWCVVWLAPKRKQQLRDVRVVEVVLTNKLLRHLPIALVHHTSLGAKVRLSLEVLP